MNATELVAKLSETHGVSKAQAKSIVDDFLKDIVDAAASGAEATGVREVQSQGDAGARRPQSGKWRQDQDCGVKEAYLLVCQIGQGPPESLSRTTAEANSGGPRTACWMIAGGN
jgi:DNA-binding protein HU-beta